MLPLGIALFIGVPVFWGWRGNLGGLAPLPSWGLSALETAAGLLTLAAGFREAVPGRERSRGALGALVCLVWIGFLIVNATTTQPAPGTVPVETTVGWVWECVSKVTAFSVPALAVVAWLVGRALPGRPAFTGALCGLGVGMMADAGLRLICWDGKIAHVVVAHGGAIAILIALGALSASVVERIKARS